MRGRVTGDVVTLSNNYYSCFDSASSVEGVSLTIMRMVRLSLLVGLLKVHPFRVLACFAKLGLRILRENLGPNLYATKESFTSILLTGYSSSYQLASCISIYILKLLSVHNECFDKILHNSNKLYKAKILYKKLFSSLKVVTVSIIRARRVIYI